MNEFTSAIAYLDQLDAFCTEINELTIKATEYKNAANRAFKNTVISLIVMGALGVLSSVFPDTLGFSCFALYFITAGCCVYYVVQLSRFNFKQSKFYGKKLAVCSDCCRFMSLMTFAESTDHLEVFFINNKTYTTLGRTTTPADIERVHTTLLRVSEATKILRVAVKRFE